MANHYFDTRKNQYDQIRNTMARYEANQKYLTEDQIQEYKDLALQASILQDNLTNLPKTKEEAYTAWINDHYNAALTGQADFYAYSRAKKKLQNDPFSLASYQSSLRKSEAYYRDVTIPQEQQRLGLPVKGSGSKKTVNGKTQKQIEAQIENAKQAEDLFNRLTNLGTKSEEWQDLNLKLLNKSDEADDDEPTQIKSILRKALMGYGVKDLRDIDLDEVQIRYSPEDKSYHFRINEDNTWPMSNRVFEVYQDKFDEAFRDYWGLDDVDYPSSLDSKFARTEVSGSGGGLTKEDIEASWKEANESIDSEESEESE
jgi:hypothetical protein